MRKDTSEHIKIGLDSLLTYVERHYTGNPNVLNIIKEKVQDLYSWAHDDLTGLHGKRDLELTISQNIERTKRYEDPFSLLIFDLDHFKQVNDTYGHLCGDYVLKEVSDLIRETKRQVDFVARYGGEEFVVVLDKAGIGGAAHFAERLRAKIETHPFIWEGKRIPVTASLGVVQYSGEEDVKGTIKKADEALYKAKEHGRNQVWIDNADVSVPYPY